MAERYITQIHDFQLRTFLIFLYIKFFFQFSAKNQFHQQPNLWTRPQLRPHPEKAAQGAEGKFFTQSKCFQRTKNTTKNVLRAPLAKGPLIPYYVATALMAIFIAKVATPKYLGLKATVLETAQASYNAEMCRCTFFYKNQNA